MTSSNVTSFSAMASYTLRWTVVTSKYDIVLLACGSRSTSRVGLPRSASAAARLIAVVVFPTPPFWLAMATIIYWAAEACRIVTDARALRRDRNVGELNSSAAGALAGGIVTLTIECSPIGYTKLHLVFAEVVRVEALEPLVQPIRVALSDLARRIEGFGVVDHRLLDEDRRPRPQRQRDRVARPGIDRQRLVIHAKMNQRVEGILLEVADHDLFDGRLEVVDDVTQQVVRHRSRRRHVLDLQGDGVRFEDPHPDGQDPLPVLVAQDDDRCVRDGVD